MHPSLCTYVRMSFCNALFSFFMNNICNCICRQQGLDFPQDKEEFLKRVTIDGPQDSLRAFLKPFPNVAVILRFVHYVWLCARMYVYVYIELF